jgi:sterol desaturase/sphingolipid hydroxylase (fatty acid hydroxylase superfamily)
MVSVKSVGNFFIINTLLFTLGVIQCELIEKMSDVYGWLFLIFMTFILRNYALMNLVDYGVRHKPSIKNNLVVEEAFKNEFNLNVVSATLVETCTYAFIRRYMFGTYAIITVSDIIWFIPVSFLFELIFDFFHYWSHRLVHHKVLYKYIHKKHHKFLHPTTIVTYYQDPLDLLITNSIPTMLTLLLVPFFSLAQYNIMLIFKEYIEISGHCGKILYPTSSFSQCIWLPRLFNIQLHTEDHDLHHSVNKCNYSKRFVIWDKLYGTYKPHYKALKD